MLPCFYWKKPFKTPLKDSKTHEMKENPKRNERSIHFLPKPNLNLGALHQGIRLDATPLRLVEQLQSFRPWRGHGIGRGAAQVGTPVGSAVMKRKEKWWSHESYIWVAVICCNSLKEHLWLMHTYINIFIIELELVLFHTNISAPYLCSIRFASAHSVARPAAAMLSVSPASLRNWWWAKVSRDANVKAQRPRCSKQPDHGEPCWGNFWMASKSLTWRKSTSRIGWMFNIVLNPGYFRWNDVRLEPVTICWISAGI